MNFPDMTDREIVEVDECYKTDGGKVNIKGYQAIDAVHWCKGTVLLYC